MASRHPVVLLGTAPNITRFEELPATDTLEGVVNHGDLQNNSLAVKLNDGTVTAIAMDEDTILGRLTGGEIKALTVLEAQTLLGLTNELESLNDVGEYLDPLNATPVPVTPDNTFLKYQLSSGLWRPADINLNDMADVSVATAAEGDELVKLGNSWVSRSPRSVVFIDVERLANFQSKVSYLHPVDVRLQPLSVLPITAPQPGDKFQVSDSRGNASNNNIIVRFGQSGQNIHGQLVDRVIDQDNQTEAYTYVNAAIGWVATSVTGSTGGLVPTGNGFEYVHTQTTAATNWLITHNLNGYPNVTVVDTSNDKVITEVRYLSNNAVEVINASAQSGKAFLS